MLGLKYLELKIGVRSVFALIGKFTDKFAHRFLSFFKNIISFFNKKDIFLLSKKAILFILGTIYGLDLISKRYIKNISYIKKINNIIKGRDYNRKSGASLYLKRISEDNLNKDLNTKEEENSVEK